MDILNPADTERYCRLMTERWPGARFAPPAASAIGTMNNKSCKLALGQFAIAMRAMILSIIGRNSPDGAVQLLSITENTIILSLPPVDGTT